MRVVAYSSDFVPVSETAPLLSSDKSRLGLVRGHCGNIAPERDSIRAATVMERFLLATLLLVWPLAAAVPTPKSHFGHEIGADRTVLDWDRVVSYFRALEASSPRIKVQELGKTAEGRPLIAAIIAAPETLQNLPRYIEIQKKL